MSTSPPPVLVRPVGMVAALALSMGTAGAVLAAPAVGPAAAYLYLGAAVVLAGWWRRKKPERLFEFALWLWVLAPGVRRVVDLVTGYHPDSFVLLAAPLVSLMAGLTVFDGWARMDRRAARLVSTVVLLAAYGGVVALVMGRSTTALGLAGVQILAPVGVAVLALTALTPGQRTTVLDRFAVLGSIVVGGYGIVQFLVAPAWDSQWLRDVDDVATSFGRPFPLEIRVFSTVNDPGSLAVVLTFALLWLLLRRRLGLLGMLATMVGAACLALTLVRSAWIVLVIAIIYCLLRGWVRPERLAAAVAALAVVFTLSNGALSPVVDRFTSSTSAGTSDESYQARVAFQSQQVLPALTSPTGAGLASTGTAVRRDGAADQRFANTDSGYIEVLRTYGGPLGVILLATTLGVVVALSRRAGVPHRAAAAFLVTVPVQLIFSGVYVGTTGLMLWLSVAALAQPRRPGSPGEPRAEPDAVAPGGGRAVEALHA